jgi:2-oxoisovalerate dehydrogenase E2 component (dihydrolipoyl transacylase)
MATTITMPQLGETVTEGAVSQWLKRAGDFVEKYEPFAEISTDKVNAEIPSPVSGVMRELLVKEGETVLVGAPIAIIDEVGAAVGAVVVVADGGAAPRVKHVNGVAAGTNGSRNGVGYSSDSGRRFSPAVRRLARQHGVDLVRVRGTGTAGRVTALDVLAAAKGGGGVLTAPRASATAYAAAVPGEMIVLTQARRLIAQRMAESKQTIPHAWTMVEVDVTNAWKWREQAKEQFEREHRVKLTLLPFFLRAVSESLEAFPLVNSCFADGGIKVSGEINLSIAVGLAGNLVLPVIRRANELSVRELAVAAAELIEKARRGALGADELAGGTFTVNNIGASGSVLSAPIIPLGQAAIVTMEAVVKRAVVRDDDAIAVRSMMNVCLSLDHRVLDGSIACAFLGDLKRRLEAMAGGASL